MAETQYPVGTILSAIGRLEVDLGLRPGFHKQLLHEDDWSFVIKVSAMVEAACSHALAHAFGHPKLKVAFGRLSQADQYVGRITLLREIGLLNKQQGGILLMLATIRNDFVHKVANAGADLKTYLQAKPQGKITEWASCVLPFEITAVHEGGKAYTRTEMLKDLPKPAIWFATLEVLKVLDNAIKRPVKKNQEVQESPGVGDSVPEE